MHMSVTFWFPPILIDIWYIPEFYVFWMLQSKFSSIFIFTSTSSLHFSQFPSGLYGHKQVILTPLGLARPRYLVSQRVFSGAGSHKFFFFFNRAIYWDMNFEWNIFLHLQQLLGMHIELPILGLGFFVSSIGECHWWWDERPKHSKEVWQIPVC